MKNYFNSETCILCKLNDELNFLVKEVMLFRGVSEYINQLVTDIDIDVVTNMFIINSELSTLLKDYFLLKFSPNIKDENRAEKLEAISKKIDSFNTGRISSIIISVFKNMVRTNYFLDKESISFKVEVKNFKKLLDGLQPNYEMFVYHPEFMGVHLRMTKVSRGGLRWSDRVDFREEIKSLMITQDGKNSIIVPAGAKGGFTITKDKEDITKEIFSGFYSKFIHNLLDLVDNRVGEEIVQNSNIINYDEVDTYFVVAADKGTAQMSDVANGISISRNFWLGDAFASGGSNGYSHKDLGITARGSFISTERFFLEKGVDFYKKPISVIGIGSMNGDVFGNGIILSSKFKLLGAISHREIFIDPNPHTEISYQERRRLFYSDNGAWSQYQKELFSKGGGVFKRADKHIQLSPEIQNLFEISENEISGDDLIKKMLTAKVDLLFNGGVGTYVKSSEEREENIADIGNRKVRVDAKDLQAFAVCEGGNLGFTQKARVEFSLKGGKINLDGIDNSAGVNISDHEVNIKILLSKTDLSSEDISRNLKNATEEVVKLVLDSSYNQALGLSLDEKRAIGENRKFAYIVNILEAKLPQFKREYFAIPSDDNFILSRPNLAFLFSYSKILITDILLKDDSKDSLLNSFSNLEYLIDYFPESFQKFQEYILKHPLNREIIATIIADKIINSQGITFLENLEKYGEVQFIKVISRYLKIEKIVDIDEVRYKLSQECEYDKLIKLEKSIIDFEKEFRTFIGKN